MIRKIWIMLIILFWESLSIEDLWRAQKSKFYSIYLSWLFLLMFKCWMISKCYWRPLDENWPSLLSLNAYRQIIFIGKLLFFKYLHVGKDNYVALRYTHNDNNCNSLNYSNSCNYIIVSSKKVRENNSLHFHHSSLYKFAWVKSWSNGTFECWIQFN